MKIRGFLFGLNKINHCQVVNQVKQLLVDHGYRVRNLSVDGCTLSVAVTDLETRRKSRIAEITNLPQHPEELVVLFKQCQQQAA